MNPKFSLPSMAVEDFSRPIPAGFVCGDRALAAMKWLAIICMLCDHINKYVFNESVPILFIIGRLTLPLFVFVLGYNLGRPMAAIASAYSRLTLRLFVFGIVASFPFVALNKVAWNWWPLNIMFTLLVAVVVAWLLDKRTNLSFVAACLVFLVGGALVEFWWMAIAACLFARAYFRAPAFWSFFGFIVSVASLFVINGNFWAMAALPLIAIIAKYWTRPLPRAQWFFYAFYPAHLTVIWAYIHFLR
jgi:hypothetical protein